MLCRQNQTHRHYEYVLRVSVSMTTAEYSCPVLWLFLPTNELSFEYFKNVMSNFLSSFQGETLKHEAQQSMFSLSADSNFHRTQVYSVRLCLKRYSETSCFVFWILPSLSIIELGFGYSKTCDELSYVLFCLSIKVLTSWSMFPLSTSSNQWYRWLIFCASLT